MIRSDYTTMAFQRAMVAPIIGMALGTAATVGGNLAGDKTRRQLQDALKTDPTYTESPYAKAQYGYAQNLLNARMPGVINAQQNIDASQANTMAATDRGATDSGQVLAMAAASQGQTDNQYRNLAQQEAQDYYNRLNNYNQGAQAMTQEHQTVYQDQVRRWQDTINIALARHGIRQQQWQSVANLGSSISSMGGMMGGSGGGGMMGGK